jgi:hypothetical protein
MALVCILILEDSMELPGWNKNPGWGVELSDPYRDELAGAGDNLPAALAARLASPIGEPAFDPEEVARSAAALSLPADARFSNQLLEQAVRVGLAHIDFTFQGNHPRYGAGAYAAPEHDGFPPTIVAAVDALTLWGMDERAGDLFDYWLSHFVCSDGSLDYYGPSLSEYGQLLTTARRLLERTGDRDRFLKQRPFLARIAARLTGLLSQTRHIELLRGTPEADEREWQATYFHNNLWVVRGLLDWAHLLTSTGSEGNGSDFAAALASALHAATLNGIRERWPTSDDWWLAPALESDANGYWERPPGSVIGNRFGSYTNYRYWPEMLSSGMLPEDLVRRIVGARLSGGGQFAGVTRFLGHLDDWPLMDHMEGLWAMGEKDGYRLCLWGHILLHQSAGHLTAYEQVSLPPGERVADYCLPCQLVAVRAAARLVRSQPTNVPSVPMPAA